jgi:nucleoside recognition membrane protein YjiH
MGILVTLEAPLLLVKRASMHATFFQKVIICAIAGFLAAALLEWGRMFVTGADDALNKGYKHTAPGVSLKSKP